MPHQYICIALIMVRFEAFNISCYSTSNILLRIPSDDFVTAYLKSVAEKDASQTKEQAMAEIRALVFLGFCSKMNVARNHLGFFEE